MNNGLQKLKIIIRESPFNRSPNYSVNVSFKNLFKRVGGLLSYNERVEKIVEKHHLSNQMIIKEITPEFQRSNTKWTQKMQRGFVENLLCGCETKIQLYDVKGRGSELGNSLVLDGLQRLTAIAAYHSGEFPVFDDLYWDDVNIKGIFPRLRLLVDIFQFDNDIEACEFYIQMNKGITHSEDDLETAYAFLNNSE
jgi:hypothetical protein